MYVAMEIKGLINVCGNGDKLINTCKYGNGA